jgi:hypothetical protein
MCWHIDPEVCDEYSGKQKNTSSDKLHKNAYGDNKNESQLWHLLK